MLKYSNINRFDNLPSEEYFAMYDATERHYSHSFLKREQSGHSPHLEMTAKIRLGKMVDAILMSPDEVNPADPEFKPGCVIASAIKAKFKGLIDNFVPQVSYTGKLSYRGLVMNVIGRLDWELPNHSAIDLKVTDAKTDREFSKVIEFMGYPNQLYNYRGLAGVKSSFIIPYSAKANCCLTPVKLEWSQESENFWTGCVIKFGS